MGTTWRHGFASVGVRRSISNAMAQCTDIVLGGPANPSVPVRLTSSVIYAIIRESSTSLLSLSFAAFGVAEVLPALERETRRGSRTYLVLKTSEEDDGPLHATARDLWATMPANLRPLIGSSRAA